jgi:Holliday junction resolvase RusA-like endonuclease
VIDLFLRCVPPSTTAQQAKRLQIVRNRRGRPVPRFFRSAQLEREAHTWATLLRPYVPHTPLTGPVTLAVSLVYPHLAKTAKRDRDRLIAKVSKPDAGNAAKHIEDTLVRMRFLEDDQQVSRLVVEKWHGPPDQVGIRIQLAPLEENR